MGRYSEKEQLNSLTEMVKLSNSFDDLDVVLIGSLDGDTTVEIDCYITLDEHKCDSLFEFIKVWAELNGDDESDWIKDKMIQELSTVEYEFLNDPTNKKMLDSIEEEQRFFTWYYDDQVITTFVQVFSTITSEQFDKLLKDNPIGDHHYTG